MIRDEGWLELVEFNILWTSASSSSSSSGENCTDSNNEEAASLEDDFERITDKFLANDDNNETAVHLFYSPRDGNNRDGCYYDDDNKYDINSDRSLTSVVLQSVVVFSCYCCCCCCVGMYSYLNVHFVL